MVLSSTFQDPLDTGCTGQCKQGPPPETGEERDAMAVTHIPVQAGKEHTFKPFDGGLEASYLHRTLAVCLLKDLLKHIPCPIPHNS